MDVYTQATMGECDQFMSDGEIKTMTVVISPTKVTVNETGDKLKIVTGCNMWQSCQNPDCYYSMISRQKKKPQAGK